MITSRRTRCGKTPFAVLVVALCAAAMPTPRVSAETIAGKFHVAWGDPIPIGSGAPVFHYSVYTDNGTKWELLMDEATLRAGGGALALNRQRVTIDGRFDEDREVVTVDRIAVADDDGRSPLDATDVLGSQAYVWILCRFADDPDTPEQPEWFESQALGPYPSQDHFWRELSFDLINILGSEVYGWYDLPEPRSYYVYDMDPEKPGDEADLGRLLDDAIAVADPEVYFPDFIGMNLIFNGLLDCCAWGGARTLELDGVTQTYGVTWMPETGWTDHGILGHEMGHSLGLPHSSGPYEFTYDSKWDVMSHAHGTCAVADAEYGCLGTHTIGPYKDKLGWIAPGRRYETSSTPEVSSITLYDLAATPPGGEHHLLHVPWATDPSQFYTVERRRMTGYDQNLPGEGAIMHEVDPSRGSDALVIDSDGDGNCNDAGAIWEPGEVFTDVANDFIVLFESADDYRTTITFSNAPRTLVFVDSGYEGYEDGSSSWPWNTVFEGHGAVTPGGNVYIEPGSYPEALTLRKSCTLWRNGISGTVTIGQ